MAQREIMTMVEFMERFNTEEKCREYLYKMRWLERFVCPHCGAKIARERNAALNIRDWGLQKFHEKPLETSVQDAAS